MLTNFSLSIIQILVTIDTGGKYTTSLTITVTVFILLYLMTPRFVAH